VLAVVKEVIRTKLVGRELDIFGKVAHADHLPQLGQVHIPSESSL